MYAEDVAIAGVVECPTAPNLHAREKEQEREWLFKGPKGNAAYGVVNSIIQGYPD